ncbi:MAG: hypothetical protein AAGJ87_08810 [Pseudomonadota bacterium]
MVLLMLAALVRASTAGTPPDVWICDNQIEVWCVADGCDVRDQDETTPLSVTADRAGALSVCAYSGCWDASAAVAASAGRILWTAEDAPFSSPSSGASGTDLTVLIVEKEGVGFVRAGGLATPLLCQRRAPSLDSTRR